MMLFLLIIQTSLIGLLVYSPKLEIKETIDLYFEFDKQGHHITRIYDKREDFSFEIIKYPHLIRNVPRPCSYIPYQLHK